MARKRSPEPPDPEPELRVTREDAAAKIKDRIAKGQELRQRDVRTVEQLEDSQNEFRRWSSYNNEFLKQIFTTSKFADEYSWWGGGVVRMYEASPQEKLEELKKDIGEKIHRLESISGRLELIPLVAGVARETRADARPHTNRVFIVHGHDEAARESVARFLEKLGIDAVILHEQATGGRTILEKLEHYADVDFAVVLLTPDDVGGTRTTKPEAFQARARQNVVLELGYFLGKLGREHVCPIYRGPLELPSDYLGVGYVELDPSGGWRLRLAKELKNAGFAVDLNAAV